MTAVQFENEYRTIQSPLYGFAMKLTRNRDRADDLMQDTFTKSFSHLTSFQDGTNLKAWMSTIMRNAFINDYRKQTTRNKYLQPMESGGGCESVLIGETANSSLMMEELNEIISTLNPTYSIPFMMYYEGFQYHEISDKLNKPLGTIKSRIFTARKLLKDAVQERFGEKSEVIADYL